MNTNDNYSISYNLNAKNNLKREKSDKLINNNNSTLKNISQLKTQIDYLRNKKAELSQKNLKNQDPIIKLNNISKSKLLEKDKNDLNHNLKIQSENLNITYMNSNKKLENASNAKSNYNIDTNNKNIISKKKDFNYKDPSLDKSIQIFERTNSNNLSKLNLYLNNQSNNLFVKSKSKDKIENLDIKTNFKSFNRIDIKKSKNALKEKIINRSLKDLNINNTNNSIFNEKEKSKQKNNHTSYPVLNTADNINNKTSNLNEIFELYNNLDRYKEIQNNPQNMNHLVTVEKNSTSNSKDTFLISNFNKYAFNLKNKENKENELRKNISCININNPFIISENNNSAKKNKDSFQLLRKNKYLNYTTKEIKNNEQRNLIFQNKTEMIKDIKNNTLISNSNNNIFLGRSWLKNKVNNLIQNNVIEKNVIKDNKYINKSSSDLLFGNHIIQGDKFNNLNINDNKNLMKDFSNFDHSFNYHENNTDNNQNLYSFREMEMEEKKENETKIDLTEDDVILDFDEDGKYDLIYDNTSEKKFELNSSDDLIDIRNNKISKNNHNKNFDNSEKFNLYDHLNESKICKDNNNILKDKKFSSKFQSAYLLNKDYLNAAGDYLKNPEDNFNANYNKLRLYTNSESNLISKKELLMRSKKKVNLHFHKNNIKNIHNSLENVFNNILISL